MKFLVILAADVVNCSRMRLARWPRSGATEARLFAQNLPLTAGQGTSACGPTAEVERTLPGLVLLTRSGHEAR